MKRVFTYRFLIALGLTHGCNGYTWYFLDKYSAADIAGDRSFTGFLLYIATYFCYWLIFSYWIIGRTERKDD